MLPTLARAGLAAAAAREFEPVGAPIQVTQVERESLGAITSPTQP